MTLRLCKRWERIVVARPNVELAPDIDQRISSERAIEVVVRPVATRGVWALHEALPGAARPWTVSHLASGRAFGGVTSLALGLRLLRVLPDEAGGDASFGDESSFTRETRAQLLTIYDALQDAEDREAESDDSARARGGSDG